jgi:hypothetical protein
MKTFYYFALMALLCILTNASVSQECANPVNIYSFTYDEVNYEIIKENLSWTAAAACAVERGGALAVIDSQEEQDTIFYHLNNCGIDVANTVAPDGGGASYVWIGGNDIAEEGTWIWDGDNDGEGPQFWEGNYNGNPVNDLYNNWGGEPDNWSNQDALGLALTDWPFGIAAEWNDVDEGNDLYYVVEYSITSRTELDRMENENILIFPNPGKDNLYFELNKPHTVKQIIIVNQLGNIVAKHSFNNDFSGELDIKEHPVGVYYIQLFFMDESAITKLLIK